ncbi:FecR domain-containing protein [Candidatus Bathyarchaeota archaeon]|nr:FecR domain-containing protein [Candidatus Bathyarchaeota archaeon]
MLLFFSVIACLSSVLFFVSSTAASSGWSRTYQGGIYDSWIPFSVIQTSDGGYAMAVFANAHYIDNVGYQGHFTTQYELYLIKLAASGNEQWKQTFVKSDGPNSEFYSFSPSGSSCSLIQTAGGDYVMNTGLWLIKVNSQGQLLWMKSDWQDEESMNYSYDLHSMILTSEGGFAMAGSTETPEGGKDFWLVKADSQGNKQWSQTYNSGTFTNADETRPREDTATNVIQTRDGGYALAGQTTTYTSLTSTYESWLVKTDAQGQQQWAKTYSGPNAAGAEYRVIQASDGGFALSTSEVRDFDFTVFQLIKTDSSGEVQWRNTYGENKDPDVTWYVDRYVNAPYAVVQLNDGGFAVAGTMTEVIENGPISHNLGLVRVNSAGNELWTKMYNAKENMGTLSEEWVYSMTRTSDGGYAIVGTTVSSWDGSHVDAFFVKTESLEQPPQPSPSPQALAISDVSGSVKVQSPAQEDAWTQANDDAALSQGSKIKTEENSGTLKLGNTTTLEIQPNTLIEIEELTDDSSTLLLQEGEFTAEVTGLTSGETVKVDMSQAVAEITGTVFTVTETGTESALSVKEGSVAFTSKVDGETVTVEADQKVVATAAGLGSTITETGALDSYTLVIVAAVAIIVIIMVILVIRRRSKKPQAS